MTTAMTLQELERINKRLLADNARLTEQLRDATTASVLSKRVSPARARVDELALKIREENPTLTPAQAFLKACDDNPGLYKALRSEESARS